MAARYRSPILASITRGFAWSGVMLTLILVYGGHEAIEAAMQTPYFDPEHSKWAALRFGAYLPAALAASATLITFGVSQLIGYIGRISFNSGLLVEAAEREENLAAGRNRELVAALKAMRDTIKRNGEGGGAPIGQELSVERFFYADASFQTLGPVSRDELKQMTQAGQLGTDSLVCCEGADHWTTLGEIL